MGLIVIVAAVAFIYTLGAVFGFNFTGPLERDTYTICMNLKSIKDAHRLTITAILLAIFFVFYTSFAQSRSALAYIRCTDPSQIINPLASNEFETGLGFYCLVEISYNVLYSALSLIGIGLLVMIAVGGLRYVVAGGDEKAIQTAKKTLTTAAAGLGIGVTSIFILIVVVSRIIKPGCDPSDVTCTGDPLQLLIPDYFCTGWVAGGGGPGNFGVKGGAPGWLQAFCSSK